MKMGLKSLPPMTFNTSRLLVATVLCWIIVYALKVNKRVASEDWPGIIMISLFGFALPQIGITLGVNLTSAGNSALIMALVPISVWIINRFLYNEDMNRWITLGVFLSFLGVVFVILGTGQGIHVSKSDLTGILMLLGSQFGAAYFTVSSGSLVEKYSQYQVIAYCMTISSIVFMVLSPGGLIQTNWSALPGTAWFSIVYSGVFALAAGNFIWVWAVKEVGSTRTAVFNSLTPLFAILTGYIFLGEKFRLLQFVGAAVILAGLIMTQKGQRNRAAENDQISS